MEKIKLPNIPAPKGHYSPAVEHNGLIYVSGQLPMNPATGEVETGSIETQTEVALRNVEAILFAADSDLNHVLGRGQRSLCADFRRTQTGAGDCSGQRFTFRHED